MGLIGAALSSAGGVLADQWKEYFYCDAIDESVLVVKGKKGDDGKEDKDPAKAMILKVLKDDYGVEEEDFLSGPALREVGVAGLPEIPQPHVGRRAGIGVTPQPEGTTVGLAFVEGRMRGPRLGVGFRQRVPHGRHAFGARRRRGRHTV